MTPFHLYIDQCENQDLLDLFSGKTGISCNDENYQLDNQGIYLAELHLEGIQGRDDLLKHEQKILSTLYQTNPLCRAEFDYQAQQLFKKYSPEKFCDHPGNTKHLALIIEDTQLIAVDFNDARNQYGYFCELYKTLNPPETRQAVMKWLNTGEAYETYRAKTHCRYICG